jgi:hypothetical protein
MEALLEHNPRSVFRAIIYYNDLSALKQRRATRLHDPFRSCSFAVTGALRLRLSSSQHGRHFVAAGVPPYSR